MNAITESLAERIDPGKMGYSPKLVAIVGAIIGYDYGVTDTRGNKLGSLSITSDGFVVSGDMFIGSAFEMNRNIDMWKFELSDEDRQEFERLYKLNIQDWRTK